MHKTATPLPETHPIEFLPPSTNGADFFERRRKPRFRFDVVLPAVFGRGDAVVLDISAEGARVVHFMPQPLGKAVRLMFVYRGRQFYATGHLLASSVKGLGTGPAGSPTYESRLRFIDCSLEAAETLSGILAQLQDERRPQTEQHARPLLRLLPAARPPLVEELVA